MIAVHADAPDPPDAVPSFALGEAELHRKTGNHGPAVLS